MYYMPCVLSKPLANPTKPKLLDPDAGRDSWEYD